MTAGHIASALVIGRDPLIVTHDATVDAVAQDLGLRTLDPVT